MTPQEEHLKRERPCTRAAGRAHDWRRFGTGAGFRSGQAHEACGACGVTRTREDYERKHAL